MICGFDTNSNDCKDRGEKAAIYMQQGYTVKDAWFKAGKQTAPSKYWAAVLYASPSDNPWEPITEDPINDHIYSAGGIIVPDPVSPKWWVWLATKC